MFHNVIKYSWPTIIKYFYYRLFHKLIVLCGSFVKIVGIKRIIQQNGSLMIGLIGPEFVVNSDPTLLYITGALHILGSVTINKGSRVCVMDSGTLCLDSCFINSNVHIMCEHEIYIGKGSAIGWGTQICDEDYHSIEYWEDNARNILYKRSMCGGGK